MHRWHAVAEDNGSMVQLVAARFHLCMSSAGRPRRPIRMLRPNCGSNLVSSSMTCTKPLTKLNSTWKYGKFAGILPLKPCSKHTHTAQLSMTGCTWQGCLSTQPSLQQHVSKQACSQYAACLLVTCLSSGDSPGYECSNFANVCMNLLRMRAGLSVPTLTASGASLWQLIFHWCHATMSY